MMFSFVASEIVRPLRIDMRHALTLSLKLQRRAPPKLSPAAKLELAALKEASDMLEADLGKDFSTAPVSVDARPLAWAAKTSWGVFHTRVESVARLEDETVPEVVQAKTIQRALFADGLDFANSDHDTLWHRGQQTLDAIARLELTRSVDDVAGEFVVRVLRKRHHSLGVALGLAGSVRPSEDATEEPVDRRALLDAITASIARYAHCLTAIDMNDAAAVRAAERALEPLVKFRAKAKASRATSDDADGEAASEKTDSTTQPSTVTHSGAANDTAAPKRNVA